MSGRASDMAGAPRRRGDLACTAEATAHQRAFVKDLQRRVVEEREPFAIAQADTPHEIFHAMDIPIVANQWWSSYIAAKQLSPHYFEVLKHNGFPASSCKYCSLGLACTLDNDPARAPWGGLPRPTVIAARLTCDCIQRVFQQWAEALGTHFFAFEAPAWTEQDPHWFEQSATDWERIYQSERIDLMVEEMKALIALLEKETGRRFDEAKLYALMERVNEQETIMGEAGDLIAGARPCLVSIAEQMPNVMIPQWHRGSPWAVAHARRFRDEVKLLIDKSAGLARGQLRLMWIGAGLWHDPGFYDALEQRHGAVFVWSMYLPFARVQYVRHDLSNPLRALASRICSMNEALHLPPWMNGWMTAEAKRWGVDAALVLAPPTNRLSISGTKFTRLSLEAAGVPTLEINADMVDATEWRHDAAVERVSEFLVQRGVVG